MTPAEKAAWSVFVPCAPIYIGIVQIATQREEPNPWFAYSWGTLLLVVTVLAGVVGIALLIGRGVRHVFEKAVNKEIERRAPPAKPTAYVAAPGSYKYPRGNVLENIYDRSLSYKWRNGMLAAKAMPEGQGYRVHDPEGNDIGFAKDRDSIAALVEGHFPEVS